MQQNSGSIELETDITPVNIQEESELCAAENTHTRILAKASKR